MSNALAIEGRFTVVNFLKQWAQTGQLTYKFSVHENALEPQRVRATFSRPTRESPAAAAVAHLYFRLDTSLRHVLSFTVESESHEHSVEDLRFDEKILDHVLRRKRAVQAQQLVRLSDEFSSTRVPSLIEERARDQRNHDREALEETLLERFQRKDPYNDGRVSFHDCRDVLYNLELPIVKRRDRDVVLAFVELDRDDMVDYGALVTIGADVLDTLVHAPVLEHHDDAVEWFNAIVKHCQFATMDRLMHLLEAFRPAPPTPDAVEETEDEATHEDVAVTPLVPPSELLVTRRQLRTTLESPALLLSRAEINLITALAVTTIGSMIPCAQLPELLQHVQSMVFSFQTRCFTDRIGVYLRQQFTEFESSKLQGSAEHLQKRIRQREINAVVKDMKKLLLSPYQVARFVALCVVTSDEPDRFVSYDDRLPRLVAWLEMQVDLDELRDHAGAVHALHQSPHELIPHDDETVRHAAIEAFEARDNDRAGVLPTRDFHASLQDLARSLELSVLEDVTDVAALTVLADPLGQGRVNYVYFQHVVAPALRWLEYEQRVAAARHPRAMRAEAKDGETDDEIQCEK